MNQEREYPPGFREAYNKHFGAEDSVQRIWESLLEWDNYQPELQGIKPLKKIPAAYLKMIESVRERIAKYDGLVLERWHNRDVSFFRKAIQAMESPILPKSSMDGNKAALIAFYQLFVHQGLRSKEDWPTKKLIRRYAEAFLTVSGVDLPGDRQWPNIYRKTGLWALRGARERKKK